MVKGAGVSVGGSAEKITVVYAHACQLKRQSKMRKREDKRESMKHLLCLCQGDAHAWVLICLTGWHQPSRTIPLSAGSYFLLIVLNLLSISMRGRTSYCAVRKLATWMQPQLQEESYFMSLNNAKQCLLLECISTEALKQIKFTLSCKTEYEKWSAMACGWKVTNKAHERWIWRIQKPHPSYIPKPSHQGRSKKLPSGHKRKKNRPCKKPLPDLLSAFSSPLLLLSFPSGFVLQSYLSTVAECWSLETARGLQIIKASRYFTYLCL